MPDNITNKTPVFKIGLVMAGAVSAGAYTAGVVDFLMEALDAWEQEKSARPDQTPQHQVRIEVITGASAGSITAAILTSALRDKNYPNISGNKVSTPLYKAWVEEIDIEKLLTLTDLEQTKAEPDTRSWITKIASLLNLSDQQAPKPGPIKSLLNSDTLDEITQKILNTGWTREKWPAYVADPLQLFLTVTNLRGVPYGIQFSGQTGNEFGMSLHADCMNFRFSNNPDSLEPDGTVLNLNKTSGLTANWKTLGEAALASSAFPVGLAARKLQREGTAAYDERRWPIPKEPDENGCCVEMQTIKPAWSNCVKNDGYVYEFENVDGGVANNEPFELARRYLVEKSGDNKCRLPREAEKANQSVIMIDPFPDGTKFDCAYKPDSNLFKVLMKLFGSMISQMRFKAEELELAKDPNVHSRWIIAPYTTFDHPAIASGSLGAFGGFLNKKFREHDYYLGRKNCQEFLRSSLLLHEDNPCLKSDTWPGNMKAELGLATQGFLHLVNNKTRVLDKNSEGRYLPVIPLYGICSKEIDVPSWPKNAMTEKDFETLAKLIQSRLDGLIYRLIAISVNRTWEAMLLPLGWKLFNLRNYLRGKNVIVSGIIDIIKQDLIKNKLL